MEIVIIMMKYFIIWRNFHYIWAQRPNIIKDWGIHLPFHWAQSTGAQQRWFPKEITVKTPFPFEELDPLVQVPLDRPLDSRSVIVNFSWNSRPLKKSLAFYRNSLKFRLKTRFLSIISAFGALSPKTTIIGKIGSFKKEYLKFLLNFMFSFFFNGYFP